jgi:hypothetical protein
MFHFFFAAVLLHPVHETVSEIEWNGETKRLEVALRLDALDEQWLQKRVGGDKDGVSKWAIKYLRDRFRVADRPKEHQRDSAQYHWIGRDKEGSHVWWYFEIEPADKKRPNWIDQRILREREDNYIHQILILDQVPRRSLTLTIERPKARFDQAEDEPESRPSNQTNPIDRRSRLDRRRND